ncbi:unnamed protein product [Hermetia illucens]|uniref:Uncharacterized protein n=1 Tax=Hermetia illucens TaxID=343691 RepID=A0A7R8YU73_HERIL|nr:unnamed protein product [Hermetia illucens]
MDVPVTSGVIESWLEDEDSCGSEVDRCAVSMIGILALIYLIPKTFNPNTWMNHHRDQMKMLRFQSCGVK